VFVWIQIDINLLVLWFCPSYRPLNSDAKTPSVCFELCCLLNPCTNTAGHHYRRHEIYSPPSRLPAASQHHHQLSDPDRGGGFLCSPKCPDLLWDPHSILLKGQRGLLPQGVKRWRLTLITDLHLMPRFRMSGAVPLFPHKHSWRSQRHFIFYLCTHKYTKSLFYALVVLLKKLGVN